MCVLSNQKHNTHSCIGSSELFLSSLAALNARSLEITISSLIEAATEGFGASVILELKICQHYIAHLLFCELMAMVTNLCMHPCVYFLTLSSALSRISLSGKAPSRGIHWSRTSCGLESSSLTGTTRDPIGWSHALDNYTGKDTLIMSEVEMFDTGSSGQALQAGSALTFTMSISSLGL